MYPQPLIDQPLIDDRSGASPFASVVLAIVLGLRIPTGHMVSPADARPDRTGLCSPAIRGTEHAVTAALEPPRGFTPRGTQHCAESSEAIT